MKTKEFFDYLLYIGIVSNDNIEILTSIVQNKTKENENNKNIDKKTFMESLMGDYLTSLDKDNLIKIGSNIYNNYITNKSLTISKHLLKLFTILENLLYSNIKYFFILWKNIHNTIKDKKNKFIQRSKSTDKLFHVPNNKQKNNLFNLNDLYSINTVNKNNKNNNNYSNTEYNNNYSNSKHTTNNNTILNQNFLTLLDKFQSKKEYDKKIVRSMNEDDVNINCTFTPNLSLTRKRNNKFRKKNESHKLYSLDHPMKIEEKPKKKVDNARMNKLYNDFQRKNIINEKLKQNIDKENGITFSPKLNVNSQYNKRIKDNFYERNQKLLEDRKDFVYGFNLLRDLQMKGIDINQITKDN